jgi:hypothetical protein
MIKRILILLIIFLATSIILLLLLNRNLLSQTIDIGTGAEINLGGGTDICATAFGNITGLVTGAGTNCTQAMPVEMMSFSASVNQDNVTLTWKTSAEENNRGFEVYRSESNSRAIWSYIGFVKGNGTKNTPTNYVFSDEKIKSGKYYYRLKQVDNNGNMQFYALNNIVNVLPPGKFELHQNYPNPFNPVTKISFTIPSEQSVSLIIYDLSGREVSEILNNKYLTPDYYTFEFNASKLASGVYFYKISSDKFSAIKKMIVIR